MLGNRVIHVTVESRGVILTRFPSGTCSSLVGEFDRHGHNQLTNHISVDYEIALEVYHGLMSLLMKQYNLICSTTVLTSTFLESAARDVARALRCCYPRITAIWTAGCGASMDWSLFNVLEALDVPCDKIEEMKFEKDKTDVEKEITAVAIQLQQAIEAFEVALGVAFSVTQKVQGNVRRVGSWIYTKSLLNMRNIIFLGVFRIGTPEQYSSRS